MTARLVALLALAAIGAPPAAGGDSVMVTIRVTVLPVCKFFTNPPPPERGEAASGVAFRYSCTNGTLPSFTLPATARATCFRCEGEAVAAGVVPLHLAARGFGEERGPLDGPAMQVVEAVLQDVPSGAQSGTMTITVSP